MNKKQLISFYGLDVAKKFYTELLPLVFLLVIVSCTSTSGIYRQLMSTEQSQFTVLGSVQVEFEVSHLGTKDGAFQQAYVLLLREASNRYEGNIDVRDITLTKLSDGVELLDAKYMAVGKVVTPIVK